MLSGLLTKTILPPIKNAITYTGLFLYILDILYLQLAPTKAKSASTVNRFKQINNIRAHYIIWIRNQK